MNVTSSSAIRFPAVNGWAWFFTIVAGACVALSANDRWAIPFVAAASVAALIAWLRVQPGFSLQIDADGLMPSSTGRRIAFQDITAIRLSTYLLFDEKTVEASRFLFIAHTQGVLRLPKSRECDRLALYLYLLPRSRLCEAPATLPGQLMRVADEERALFPDRVLATKGREVLRGEFHTFATFWYVSLVAFAGYLTTHWLESVWKQNPVFSFFTAFGIVLGLIFSTVSASRRSVIRKQRAASGLVISPRSLTMDSPRTKGVLKWSEITYLMPVGSSISGVRALAIGVDGGRILLMDDYTCPLTEIYRQIHAHWSFEHQ